MKIIIVGSGKTGGALMRQLIADGHTVTVVDTDEDVLERPIGASSYHLRQDAPFQPDACF